MPRRRLSFASWPAVVYAIGDVHGCLSQLVELEAAIAADAARIEGKKWIVTLGDYVDRGPQSAQVIEHLLEPPLPGFTRFSLAGNHEQMMLDFLDDPVTHSYWLDEGGMETLQSYRLPPFAEPLAPDDDLIPAAHLEFLRGLPIILLLPGWLFVHAGIRPGLALAEQSDEDLLWIREPFLSLPVSEGLRVVHGHTPGGVPVETRHRICIDTQCFAGGRLTAVRITPDGATSFLSARS